MSMFNLFSQLHAIVEGGQQVVTQAVADVAMMQMFLHQWLVLQTLSEQSNKCLK